MDLSVAFYLSYIALWVLVILHSAILLGVLRSVYGSERETTSGSATAGAEAPDFVAVDINGTPFDSSMLRGRLRGLLFVSTTCTSCISALDVMKALRERGANNIVVICRDSAGRCADIRAEYGLDGPIVVDDGRVGALYGVKTVPTAVVINENDRIQSVGSPMANDLEGVLVETAGANEAAQLVKARP